MSLIAFSNCSGVIFFALSLAEVAVSNGSRGVSFLGAAAFFSASALAYAFCSNAVPSFDLIFFSNSAISNFSAFAVASASADALNGFTTCFATGLTTCS